MSSGEKARKSILCRLGFHKWVELGWMNLMLSGIAYECVRCHRRKACYWYGTFINEMPNGGWQDSKLEEADPRA